MLWITHIGACLTFKQQDEKQDDIFKKESRKRHNPQGTNEKIIPAREGLDLYIKQKSFITHRNKSTEIIVTTKDYSYPSKLSLVGYVCIKPNGIMPF